MATNQWVIQAGSECLYPAATAITAPAPTRKIRVAANMRLRSEEIRELSVSGVLPFQPGNLTFPVTRPVQIQYLRQKPEQIGGGHQNLAAGNLNKD